MKGELNGARVMIVEDQRIVAKDIRESLVEIGYDVVGTASTGEAAIALAQERYPDLILMDIILKGRMDGIDAAKAIRSRDDIPVVYITGQTDARILDRLDTSGPYGIVFKPFDIGMLDKAIARALRWKAAFGRLPRTDPWSMALAEAMGAAFFLLDKEHRIVLMNKRAADLTGLTMSQCLGRRFSHVITVFNERTGREVSGIVRRTVGHGHAGSSGVFRLDRKDGSAPAVLFRGSRVVGGDGGVIGSAMVVQELPGQLYRRRYASTPSSNKELTEAARRMRRELRRAFPEALLAMDRPGATSTDASAEDAGGAVNEGTIVQKANEWLPERARMMDTLLSELIDGQLPVLKDGHLRKGWRKAPHGCRT